jgi:hypothetical protein
MPTVRSTVVRAVRTLVAAERIKHLLFFAAVLKGGFRRLYVTVSNVNGAVAGTAYLFLLKLELLRLQHRGWYAQGAFLRTQHQIPELFTELGAFGVEEALELHLELLDLRLHCNALAREQLFLVVY